MSEAPLHMHRTCEAKQLIFTKGPLWAQEKDVGPLYRRRLVLCPPPQNHHRALDIVLL